MALDLSLIAAPMVNQSDLPFRLLVRRHGATLAYTQMIVPENLFSDRDYLEFHQRDLITACSDNLGRPVVVQVCGNDPDKIIQAGRLLQGYCDGIDLNLGCPQEIAKTEHFGAYLLGTKDWPLVENIVSAMSRSFTVPVSAKIRLAQPASLTPVLAARLEAAGASWITLHARAISARRRRQGPADLAQVRHVKEVVRIPVISNGNVRTWDDVMENRKTTGADGVMVGETLLGNPWLFEDAIPDPVEVSLEYLQICREYPETVTIQNARTHVRHFVDFQCGRRPWFAKFRTGLSQCESIDEIDSFLRFKVSKLRWRRPTLSQDNIDETDETYEGSFDITWLDA